MQIKATRTFNVLFHSTKKIVVARGGTRAGKTYAIMQMIALWLLTGTYRGIKTEARSASIVRKTLPSLKATAMRDFDEVLMAFGVFSLVAQNKTDHIYTYGGRMVEFFSVDDPQKVRSRKRDILVCIEANELEYETDFFQLLIRTTESVMIDFNPSDPYGWIKLKLEDERQHEKGDVEVFVFTHWDNGFISDEHHREIESIKDPVLREVYVHGRYGQVKGLVYPDVTIVSEMPDLQDFSKYGLGLDFGFTNSPTAVIRCGIKGDAIFLDEVLYETGLLNTQIVERLQEWKDEDVYCDSAEPKSIAELQAGGLRRARATEKGKETILYGIQLVSQYKIHITARSKNLLREQKIYKYKTKPNGDPDTVPIKDFDHGWDAVRYWALMNLAKRRSFFAQY